MASDVTRRLTLVEVPLRTPMAEDIFVSISICTGRCVVSCDAVPLWCRR
jgi:hypothetical protein